MDYSKYSNQELEKLNQDLMQERAKIKLEQQAITEILDDRFQRHVDVIVVRRLGYRTTKEVPKELIARG